MNRVDKARERVIQPMSTLLDLGTCRLIAPQDRDANYGMQWCETIIQLKGVVGFANHCSDISPLSVLKDLSWLY